MTVLDTPPVCGCGDVGCPVCLKNWEDPPPEQTEPVYEKPHLSHSQIEMLARCEKQWEFRYVYGIRSPPGVASTIGKATHTAVEKNLLRKMSWGVLMEREEVQQAAADSLQRRWDKEPPVVTDRDPSRGQAVDMAVSLAELHHDQVAPKITPIAIEQAFMIDVPQLDYNLMGVVDVETPTHVRDTKTKSKKPTVADAVRSPQMALYHLRSTLAGTPHKKVALDYLIKTKERQYVEIESSPDESDHNIFIRRMELAVKSIKAGVFKPTSPGGWECTERFCGYWERCEFGSRKVVGIALIDPARLTTRIVPRPHDDAEEHAAEEG